MGEPVTVRVFGTLRDFTASRGVANVLEVDVPDTGITAREIAVGLGIPPERIEGVFVNRTVHGIAHAVFPGDRIAFVPDTTPGPHRVFLGLYTAGKDPEA